MASLGTQSDVDTPDMDADVEACERGDIIRNRSRDHRPVNFDLTPN